MEIGKILKKLRLKWPERVIEVHSAVSRKRTCIMAISTSRTKCNEHTVMWFGGSHTYLLFFLFCTQTSSMMLKFCFHFNWDLDEHLTAKLTWSVCNRLSLFSFPTSYTSASKAKIKMPLGEDREDMLRMNLLHKRFHRDFQQPQIMEDFVHVLSYNKRFIHNIC